MLELVGLGRAGDDQPQSACLHVLEQLPGLREGTKRRQKLLREDGPPALAELPRLIGIIIPPGHFLDDLIAAFTDQPPDSLESDVDSRLRESLDPGVGMGVVAVNERTVNIKQNSANRAHGIAFEWKMEMTVAIQALP